MTPQTSECPLAGGQVANQTTNNNGDFATAQGPGKAVATLKARFALAGHQVHEGSNNDFVVTRWGLSRYCSDFDAMTEFARVVGVQHVV